MGVLDKVRKSAENNSTRIQTSEARELEKICNQLFLLDKDIDEEVKFVKHVMTRGLESKERKGLHASSMLVDDKALCLRAQVLSLFYKQSQGEDLPIGLLRIFEEGNAIHEKWQRLFIRGGYGKALQMDKTNFDKEYQMSFTPDIICKIPKLFDFKLVGEIKSVNTFIFKKMKRHTSAWKQLQWYMHLMIKKEKEKGTWNGKDFTKGFVLNDSKNDSEFSIELYDYDEHLVLPFIERAEEITYLKNRLIDKKKMIKRPDDASSPDCKRCDKCNMKEACWDIGIGRVLLD